MQLQRRGWAAFLFATACVVTSWVHGQEVRLIKLKWDKAEDVGIKAPTVSTLVKQPASSTLAESREIAYVECLFRPKRPDDPKHVRISSYSVIGDPAQTALLSRDASRLLHAKGIPLPTSEKDAPRTRVFVIYNPQRSASGPAARLESVVPVGQVEYEGKLTSLVVSVRLDAKGEIVDVTADPHQASAFREAAEECVRQWKFSKPWRLENDGSASVRVTVTPARKVDAVSQDKQAAGDSPPRAVELPRVSNVEASGMLSYEAAIDASGKLKRLTIVGCDNPKALSYLVDQVFATTFAPGKKGGVPVEATLRSGYGVRASVGMFTGIVSPGFYMARPSVEYSERAIAVTRDDGAEAAPKYDVPPSAINLPKGYYPFELLKTGTEGKVEFIVSVQKDGSARLLGEAKASRPEFALSAQAIIDAFRFEPGRKNGVPVEVAFRSDIEFSRNGGLAAQSDSALRLLKVSEQNPNAIVDSESLDVLPEQIVFLDAVFPSRLRGTVESGSAEIEFFIDKDGHAQLPRIVSATAEEFGYAAAQAATVWRFTPPKKNGKAVIARMRKVVEFDADKTPLP